MIKDIRHTSKVVKDLDASKNFYLGLGFKILRENIEEGSYIENLTDINNAKLKWAMLISDKGAILELIEYINPALTNEIILLPPNRIGFSHIAFTIENIEDFCELVKKLGGSVINSPEISNEGHVKVAYCYDNEGALIEAVEEL